jgi:hypothetical protein
MDLVWVEGSIDSSQVVSIEEGDDPLTINLCGGREGIFIPVVLSLVILA